MHALDDLTVGVVGLVLECVQHDGVWMRGEEKESPAHRSLRRQSRQWTLVVRSNDPPLQSLCKSTLQKRFRQAVVSLAAQLASV
jgi:hypothetical protein